MIPQLRGSVSDALLLLVPVGKGAALGVARALGNRAVRWGCEREQVQPWGQPPLVLRTESADYSKNGE